MVLWVAARLEQAATRTHIGPILVLGRFGAAPVARLLPVADVAATTSWGQPCVGKGRRRVDARTANARAVRSSVSLGHSPRR